MFLFVKMSQLLCMDLIKESDVLMPMGSEVDQELLRIYLIEAQEQLEKFNDILLVLEKNPEAKESLNELFRIAHTLKGTSGMVGFDDIKESMHAAEDLMDAARAGNYQLTSENFDLLFSFCDAVSRYLNNQSATFAQEEWVNKLRSFRNRGDSVPQGLLDPPLVLSEQEKEQISLFQEQGKVVYGLELDFDSEAPLRSATSRVFLNTIESFGTLVKTAPDIGELTEENYCRIKAVCVMEEELTDEVISRIMCLKYSNPGVLEIRWRQWVYHPQEAKLTGKESLERNEKVASETIRVDSEKLQKLLNTVGDLISVRASLEEAIHNDDIYGQGLNTLKLQMHQFNQTLSVLQTEVMQLRMVPIKQLFSRYPRIVRDLAHKSGKEVNLTFQGEETEIDKKVMEELVDPLTHIIRNALDHGIEGVEDRRRNGKSEIGSLQLSASQEGNHIVIEIRDDGAGINLEKVMAKALQRGVAQVGKDYSETEVIDFLFAPGFSTAEKVTEISGRGVGLDVVRTNLTRLNGSVTVTTQKGAGTVFRLAVPLTLAIINAFLVKVTDQVFAIPAHDVIENIVIVPRDIHRVEGLRAIRLRDEVIPLTDLGQCFYQSQCTQERRPVVIVGNNRRKSALIVDEFLEPREIMIKPINSLLGEIEFVSGVTVLGNGQVAMILNTAPLVGCNRRDLIRD